MAVIQGDLGRVGVPELFRAIADDRRTGSLTLVNEGQKAVVYFREGQAYHARFVASGIQLGTRLISAGFLSHEDLEESLVQQKSEGGGRRLGEILVENSVITEHQLQKIVRQQIEDTIFETLRWDGGEFEFEPDTVSKEDIGLEVSVENLVMEGARRFREWHQISRRVPTLDVVPSLNEDDESIEVALTPEEWALVSHADGKSTVRELAQLCGFTDLEAARTVFGLVTTGLLKIELPEGVELPPDDPELEAVFDELENALRQAASEKGHAAQVTLEDLVAGAVPEVVGIDELEEIADEDRIPSMQVTDSVEPASLVDDSTEPAIEEAPAASREFAATVESLVVMPEPEVVMPEPELAIPEPTAYDSALEADFAQVDPDIAIPEPAPASAEPAFLEDVEPEAVPISPDELVADVWVSQLDAVALPETEIDAELTETEPAEPVSYSNQDFDSNHFASQKPGVAYPDPAAFNEPTQPLPSERDFVSQHPGVAYPEPEVDLPSTSEAVEVQPSSEPALPWAAQLEIHEPSNGNGDHSATAVMGSSWAEAPIDIAATETAEILAEERVDRNMGLSSMFSDLASLQASEPQPTSVATYPQPSEQEVPVEDTPLPAEEPKAVAREVDPMVDTTALLREFSGLGLGEEDSSIGGWGSEGGARSSQSTEEKRGLFGRKKR